MTRRLKFIKHLAFSQLPSGWRVSHAGTEWGGNPLLLIEEGKPPYPTDDRSVDAQVKWMNTLPTANHLVYWEGSSQRAITLEKQTLGFAYHVQRFDDGWLIAAGRGGHADVCDKSGRVQRTIDLGDASEDIQTTANGHIWVSYFDEGVFGRGIGQHGVVCFDNQGQAIFKYSEFAEQNQLPFIDDCYAMNVVSDDEVWLSYYSDFPLVCIRNFRLHHIWKDFGCMQGGFALRGDAVVFPKCYTQVEGKSQILIRTLSTSSAAESIEAVDENGSAIDGLVTAFGRGPNLYLLTETALYSLQAPD